MDELLKQIVAGDPSGLVGSGLQTVRSHFGTPGVAASLILGGSIAALIISKLLKIAFNIFRYVVIPSVVVTFIASSVLPYPFVSILPVSVALFSVVLIIKG